MIQETQLDDMLFPGGDMSFLSNRVWDQWQVILQACAELTQPPCPTLASITPAHHKGIRGSLIWLI